MTSDEPMTLLEFKNQRIMHWAEKAASLAEALTNANKVIERQAHEIERLRLKFAKAEHVECVGCLENACADCASLEALDEALLSYRRGL